MKQRSTGNELQKAGANERALQEYDATIKEDPADTRAYLNKGIVLLNTGKWKQAEKTFSDALLTNPKSRDRSMILDGLAVGFDKQGKDQEAVAELKLAIQADPEYAMPYFHMGKLLHDRDEKEAALNYYLQAIRRNPNLNVAYFNAGSCLRKSNPRAAMLFYDRMIRLEPESKYVLDARIHCSKLKKIVSIEGLSSAERDAEIRQLVQSGGSIGASNAVATSNKTTRESASTKVTSAVPDNGETSATPFNKVAPPEKTKLTTQEKNRPVEDKWALVIGISKFQNPQINLQYSAADAENFAKFLTTEQSFAPDHVKVLVNENATRSRILAELGDKWLPRVANPDDLVVIYLSTHGSPSDLDVDGVNYLIAHDTDVNSLYATGIAMQDLARIIKARIHCDRIVIVLDACYSGVTSPTGKGLVRTGNVDADSISQGTGQLVISSSAPNQRSWESNKYSGGVFTKNLIDGFRGSGPRTKLEDAFNWTQQKVREEVLRERGQLQTPILKSTWSGKELILGAPPAHPRPGL